VERRSNFANANGKLRTVGSPRRKTRQKIKAHLNDAKKAMREIRLPNFNDAGKSKNPQRLKTLENTGVILSFELAKNTATCENTATLRQYPIRKRRSESRRMALAGQEARSPHGSRSITRRCAL
jgi:hypothetical protein